jgi:hypothetical protein
MPHLSKLQAILTYMEELMGDPSFIDQLDGEEQGFLDTVWDFFDRLATEFDPELEVSSEDGQQWQIQQDAETD